MGAEDLGAVAVAFALTAVQPPRPRLRPRWLHRWFERVIPLDAELRRDRLPPIAGVRRDAPSQLLRETANEKTDRISPSRVDAALDAVEPYAAAFHVRSVLAGD